MSVNRAVMLIPADNTLLRSDIAGGGSKHGTDHARLTLAPRTSNGGFMLILSEAIDSLNQFTSLGAAGIMGAMWLWERRSSRTREQQLDESHARIMGDRVQVDQLIEVVKNNAEAMTRLSATQEQFLREMSRR